MKKDVTQPLTKAVDSCCEKVYIAMLVWGYKIDQKEEDGSIGQMNSFSSSLYTLRGKKLYARCAVVRVC